MSRGTAPPGLILLAIARTCEVGIDVEAIRPFPEDVAGRLFAPAEAAALARLPEPERLATFYRLWTRKEAALKATGEGLSRALDTFDTSGWQIADLAPAPGYAAALASRPPGWRWRWMS